MTIDRAELRSLIAVAVESGASCDEDYRSHGKNQEWYQDAIDDAIEVTTDRVLTLIEKDKKQ